MSMMESSNPALSPSVFEGAMSGARSATMTISGTVNRAMILTGLCAATAMASYGWMESNLAVVMPAVWISMIGGLVLGLAMRFKPETSPFLAPVYALAEGVFVGAASLVYAMYATKVSRFTGGEIIMQASVLTFGTLFAMLMLYRAGWVRASGTFKKVMMIAGIGVCLFCASTWLLPLAGVNMGFVYDGGPIAIAISVVFLLYGAFRLVIDFDRVEQGVDAGAPKYMEWYCGFGLLVTLVWLYLEFLRLLSMLNRRD